MKISAKIGLIIIGIIGTFMVSCRKFEKYPIEPVITFDNFTLLLNYERQNGTFVEVPLLSWNPDTQKYDTITFNGRFPNLTPEHGNKAIKGVIQDTLYVNNPLSDFDTIKFKVSIYDRALHKSNEVETPMVVVKK